MSEQIITENAVTTFKQIVTFHGLLLTVVEHNGVDYIPLKPIVESLGTQWKSARISAFNGDNAYLYGTCELKTPVFNESNTDIGAKYQVFILLEAGEAFLMRSNTNKIRSHGNEKAADYLLNLQKEWRKALHDYQTLGVAYKSNAFNQKKELKELLNARKLTSNPIEKTALSSMIKDEFASLGYPLAAEPQGELDV